MMILRDGTTDISASHSSSFASYNADTSVNNTNANT